MVICAMEGLSCFYSYRKMDPSSQVRLLIQTNGSESKACLFEITPKNQSQTGKCTTSVIEPRWKDCKKLSLEDPHGISMERFATNQILKVLSEVRLSEQQLKNQLKSAVFFAEDNFDIKDKKKLEDEVSKSLKKQGLDSKVWISKDSDNIEFLLSSRPENENWSILSIASEETQIASASGVSSKPQKIQKEAIGFNKYWLEKDGIKENTHCRQAFSPFLRSTGKTGEDNYQECKNFLKEKIKKMKIFQDKKILENSDLFGYGNGFKQISELFKTETITKQQLESASHSACFLSIVELMNDKKISKESSKTMCYSISLVIAILETIEKEQIKVFPKDHLAKLVASSSLVDPDCGTNTPKPKK